MYTHPTGSSSYFDIDSGFSITESFRGRIDKLPPFKRTQAIFFYYATVAGAKMFIL